jgi:hypothetical protein
LFLQHIANLIFRELLYARFLIRRFGFRKYNLGMAKIASVHCETKPLLHCVQPLTTLFAQRQACHKTWNIV